MTRHEAKYLKVGQIFQFWDPEYNRAPIMMIIIMIIKFFIKLQLIINCIIGYNIALNIL